MQPPFHVDYILPWFYCIEPNHNICPYCREKLFRDTLLSTDDIRKINEVSAAEWLAGSEDSDEDSDGDDYDNSDEELDEESERIQRMNSTANPTTNPTTTLTITRTQMRSLPITANASSVTSAASTSVRAVDAGAARRINVCRVRICSSTRWTSAGCGCTPAAYVAAGWRMTSARAPSGLSL
jgi:hypothetical protein